MSNIIQTNPNQLQNATEHGKLRKTTLAAGAIVAGVTVAMFAGNGSEKVPVAANPDVACIDSQDTFEHTFKSGEGSDVAVVAMGGVDTANNFENDPCIDDKREQVAEQLQGQEPRAGQTIHLTEYTVPIGTPASEIVNPHK